MADRNWFFTFVNRNDSGALCTDKMDETVDNMDNKGFELVGIFPMKSGSLLFVGWKKSAGRCPMLPLSAMRQIELDVE